MRKIREVLRLRWSKKLAGREVGRSVRVSPTTVSDYESRARLAGLRWPLPDELDDGALEALLFPPIESDKVRVMPDFAEVHRELRRSKYITLHLLWEEYKDQEPDGYQRSRFCALYREWNKKLDVCMRQHHVAGEKIFVDYAGATIPIHDPVTGEVSAAALFIAALGASSYTYAEVCEGQDLRSWLGAHVRMFRFFKGVSEIVVPDNLKAGVTSPCRYEPDINTAYAELADHYGVAVIPARVRKPQDKAKVETAVKVAEYRIVARLRNRRFFSIVEAQQAVLECLEELNERPFQKLKGSRRSLFEELDAPALKPLPTTPYTQSDWSRETLGRDYHIELDGHYYSVPYKLVGELVEIRSTERVVEVLHKGRRVASHSRSNRVGGATTDHDHMPATHRAHAEWTPAKILKWGDEAGEATAKLMAEMMDRRPHPQQGYRSCLGIIRLASRYDTERVEAACQRALAVEAYSYKSVESILKKGLDREPLEPCEELPAISHDNIRGPGYYDGPSAVSSTTGVEEVATC